MFVPLPVPFVFQRTASDFSAWRLKSSLAPRSSPAQSSDQTASSAVWLSEGRQGRKGPVAAAALSPLCTTTKEI
ncbi:POU domain, class 2, transcription factor 1 [Lates japonicus]|uniref:POU domain, class 2, transcription factor 1 n=1 Tax=Lates japonicus TaxID=270547 RepID=A0AAD3N1N8_LATJO|nr:POU domain, class 2, transcription factor 1 [Lates japonicus]